MLMKFLHKERRVIQFYTLVITILLSVVLLTITAFTQQASDEIERTEIRLSAQSTLDIEKDIVVRSVNVGVADVLYINDGLLQNFEAARTCTDLRQQWIIFSNRMGIYDQMRYIDQNGDEIIRINYDISGAVSVEGDALQNKSDRYYFTDTMALPKGHVFISELDLNIENGVIEQPIKPMIRIATPIIGDDEAVQGIVILNYLVEDMLKQLRQLSSRTFAVYLLNAQGYWLYNSEDSEKQWAFMYPDRQQESLANEFPLEWETITADRSGFLSTDHGIFIFDSITIQDDFNNTNLALHTESNILYVVTYIDPQSPTGLLFAQGLWHLLGRVVQQYLSLYFLASGVAFALAVLIAMNRARRKEIRFFSEHDVMTGVYNRRAGYQKLNSLKNDVAGRDCTICVCFIDINGLKEVNDQLGHDAGDELIKSVVEVIKANVRSNDFVSRLGGDEFLIVFSRLSAEGSEAVWKRITEIFAQINARENRKYLISVSHGIGVFRCGGEETIDEIITMADAKMYEEKRVIKKGLSVIRQPGE